MPGSVAVLAEPHRYFYPLDFANNFRFAWSGAGYRDVLPHYGFGIRQPLDGDKRFVPWFNAPPKTRQHLSFFLLVSPDKAKETFEAVGRYTPARSFLNRFPGMSPSPATIIIEHTLDYLRRQKEQNTNDIPKGLESPGFVRTFRKMGVDIVHLAEFHNGRTPKLEAPERLRQLNFMHRECQRLSDENFLLLPGEEPNVHLGGHWISFFPKPVYWVLNRKGNLPFTDTHPKYGTVYHVGSTEDVLNLMKREGGLMWTAHARIKSSTGFPDLYRHRDFYRSDHFLGAAWKAMPADLSHDRLGLRILDLQDDMANWGPGQKYVLGEVDVFKVQPDYELYGHMNINYLKLDRIPRFEDGWQPVLDALRNGEFFVSTGEVLIPAFSVSEPQIEANLEWSFPLSFAEIISGDGETVRRKRIELSNTTPFGSETFQWQADLKDQKWARLEVWDVAGNGAFTQPVWLD